MFFRTLHNRSRCFSSPGSGRGGATPAALRERSSGLSQQSTEVFAESGFHRAGGSPLPRGADGGHWELKAQRAGGPPHLAMCFVSCTSVGIEIDLSFAGSKVQGMTCLSLQVFF